MGAKSCWFIGSKLAEDCLVLFNQGTLRGLKCLPFVAILRSARREAQFLNLKSCRDGPTFLP